MKVLDIIVCALALVSVVLCQRIITHSLDNQERKTDYAELNDIKYGLLSIASWKEQLSMILAEEIDKLYQSKATEQLLRQQIEAVLNKLIDQIERKIKEEHSDTLGGQIAQSLLSTFVDLDQLKKGIPEYTDTVIRELKKTKTREQVKAVLNKQIQEYSNQTFDIHDTSLLHRIVQKTGAEDIATAKHILAQDIAATKRLIARETVLLIVLAVIPFAVYGLSKATLSLPRIAFLLLPLLMLLAGGVGTPAIDLEAKISHIRFILMTHPVQFENQILYFKSKSILQVFRTLIAYQDLQMKLVGILVITFSVVFPLLKIAASVVHHLDYRHASRNRVIEFFVIKSGKWSMADVMVVALFMAYIGFDGVINDQLQELNFAVKDLAMLTTNGTSLQPGFYLFLAYTLLAIVFSGLLTRTPRTL